MPYPTSLKIVSNSSGNCNLNKLKLSPLGLDPKSSCRKTIINNYSLFSNNSFPALDIWIGPNSLLNVGF